MYGDQSGECCMWTLGLKGFSRTFLYFLFLIIIIIIFLRYNITKYLGNHHIIIIITYQTFAHLVLSYCIDVLLVHNLVDITLHAYTVKTKQIGMKLCMKGNIVHIKNMSNEQLSYILRFEIFVMAFWLQNFLGPSRKVGPWSSINVFFHFLGSKYLKKKNYTALFCTY